MRQSAHADRSQNEGGCLWGFAEISKKKSLPSQKQPPTQRVNPTLQSAISQTAHTTMAPTQQTPLVVFVTTPNIETARHVSRSALQQRLVACANIVPTIESHFWWQGKLESEAECLVIFKTLESQRLALQELVLHEHPYDVPEFVCFPISSGNPAYLDWLTGEVTSKADSNA